MFLSKLLARLGPKRLNDPFFGPVVFMKARQPCENYWEGASLFSHGDVKREIELFITTDENGPTQLQRDFYCEIQTRYAEWITEVASLLKPMLPPSGHFEE